MRLHLVGDDEALDLLAELARHLPVATLSRTDVVPDRLLDADDVVVIGVRHPRLRAQAMRDALARGTARLVTALPEDRDADQPGARAILIAAELVVVLLPVLAEVSTP